MNLAAICDSDRRTPVLRPRRPGTNPGRSGCALIFVCATLFLATAKPASAAQEEFPVWWSPSLELESLDQIDAILNGALPDSIQFRVRGRAPEAERKWAATCREFMRLNSAGLRAPHETDAGRIQTADVERLRRKCYTLIALLRATPSARSFVHDFEMGENALDFLPQMLGAGCRDLRAAIGANRKGIPWSKSAPAPSPTSPYKIVVRDRNTFVIEYWDDDQPTMEWDTTILARADLDADGQEDLLVIYEVVLLPLFTGETPRTFFGSLLLMTREGPNDVLRVTEVPAPLDGCNISRDDLANRSGP